MTVTGVSCEKQYDLSHYRNIKHNKFKYSHVEGSPEVFINLCKNNARTK